MKMMEQLSNTANEEEKVIVLTQVCESLVDGISFHHDTEF